MNIQYIDDLNHYLPAYRPIYIPIYKYIPSSLPLPLLSLLQSLHDDIVTSYELQIELQNITRNIGTDINGNQTLTDLSVFPRLRVTGASTVTVRIDGVLVGFEQPSYSVREDIGQFRVCVVVIRPPESDPLNQTFFLSVSTSTGTAGTYVFIVW